MEVRLRSGTAFTQANGVLKRPDGFVQAALGAQSDPKVELHLASSRHGQGGAPVDAAKCPWAANISGTFSYQVPPFPLAHARRTWSHVRALGTLG